MFAFLSAPSSSSTSSCAAAPSTRRRGAAPRTWRPLLLTAVACALGARAEVAFKEDGGNATLLAGPGLESDVSAIQRRLAIITNMLNPNSTDITVAFDVASIVCSTSQQCTRISALYAALPLITVQITVKPDSFALQPSKLRVVKASVDSDGASLRGECAVGQYETAAHAGVVSEPWSAAGTTVQVTQDNEVMSSRNTLTFLQGGLFKICYSDDGTFRPGHADVVRPPLQVYGVYDQRVACSSEQACLTTRPYRCFINKMSHNNMENAYDVATSCIVDYSKTGQGFEGTPGKMTWSARAGASYTSDGFLDEIVNPARCGTTPEDILCNSGGTMCLTGGSQLISPNVTAGNKQVTLPAGRNDLDEFSSPIYRAVSVAACYCPSYDDCDEASDFIQQIGILHFYITKTCYIGFAAFACTEDFVGTTPQHRFALRLECPSDGCKASHYNRIKVVAQSKANDLPAWAAGQGCGAAVHGVNSWGKTVFDADSPDVASLHGGIRQDFKYWNWKNTSSGLATSDQLDSGFVFKMGTTDHELRNFHDGETFDICYCDSNCEDGAALVDPLAGNANWFKVGQFRLAPFQLVSAASNTTDRQDEFIITYINQPGSLGFYRPKPDYNVMGLQEEGFVKLVEDHTSTMDDAGCRSATYDAAVEPAMAVMDPSPAAATTFRGKTNATVDENKLMFNNGLTLNRITMQRAGFFAVCYCSRANFAYGCTQIDGVEQWVVASRLTIRGPDLNQRWEFSAYVTFRMEFTGYGLTSDDVIRIIPGNGHCDDNNQDGGGGPNAAYTETYMKLQCPHPCSEVGETNAGINGNIEVKVLADNAYMCDEKNEDCRNNDIKSIRVLDDQTTEVEFEAAHTMSDGDLITLKDNIECAANSPREQCSDERLSVLKGNFNFVDRDANYGYAPDTYSAGHIVTTTTDPKKLRIPVGWADPKPQFAIRYAFAKRGRWTRHNRAITKEEIMGRRERVDMKVCWAYLGTPDRDPRPQMRYKHVAEMGKITLMEPNMMGNVGVSLTTMVKGQADPWAPLVISFSTAEGATGSRYQSVQGPTRLRIFFTRTLALYASFGDGGVMEVNPGEDEMVEARQYICGKIFRELWSSDTDLGFPMPRGCYYQRYGMTQEISILFDSKNGLNSGKQYQLVMTGVATNQAVTNQEYVQLLTMDDVDLKPYAAIERGIGMLTQTPMDAAYGGDGVQWLPDAGARIVGGQEANLNELREGSDIRFQLKGNPLGGGIKASSVIRIFLWPLTMWSVETRCTASCIPYDEVAYPCGAVQDCIGDSIVSNSNKNFIRIVMPATMSQMTAEVSHTLVISQLKMPPRGFFASRLGLELRKPDDTKPDYIETSGDFIWKQPQDGSSVAKLVNYYGDGDNRPFKGDERNLIYVKILLGATLYSNVQQGDATMKLVLPTGYRCIRDLDIDGNSPWRAPDILGVFGDQIPQGTGSPDEGSGTRGWSVANNTCLFTLRQNGVIYAGSALTVRLTVDNPEVPKTRSDDSNRWQVVLKSKGSHQYHVEFPPVFFATQNDDHWCNNKAVLGRITDTKLVPSHFAVSQAEPSALSPNWLRVFFKSEQPTGVYSKVVVEIPDNYTVSAVCHTRHLPPHYYFTHPTIVQASTKRLPGVQSCEFHETPFRHMKIDMLGSIMGGEHYAFEVEVHNPRQFFNESREVWKVITRSEPDFDIDGTPNSTTQMADIVSNQAGLDDGRVAFGLYQHTLNSADFAPVRMDISSLLPYSITGERAVLNMSLRVPMNCYTTLRIVAPRGFQWDFEEVDFKYQSIDLPEAGPFMATSSLPGGAPLVDPGANGGNVLLWQTPNQWLMARQYAFSAYIRVPDLSPAASVNDFIVEFGHTSDIIDEMLLNQDRVAAEVLPAPPVRALASAKIDYLNNVQSKDNLISFQVEVITPIPHMGGLRIAGPAGYIFDAECTVLPGSAERGTPYDTEAEMARNVMLPSDVACRAPEPNNRTGDPTPLQIIAGPSGIPAGRYRWQLAVINPNVIVPNPYTAQAPCGYYLCWTFESRNPVLTNGPHLDAPTSASGFRINKKIVEALIPDISDLQKAMTGRDDRPARYNPIVFAIKLNEAQLYPEDLVIRGPAGSIFREDCLQDVETRQNEVFGNTGSLIQVMPEDYTPWPVGVDVTSCRGEGSTATLRVDPKATDGLQPEKRYPFRVALLHNPTVTPSANTWTISYGEESSDPIAGYELWTFGRTSISTVSVGASTAVTGEDFFENPVTFTFMPYNGVRGKDMQIRVTAPPNFEIAHTGYFCRAMIQPITADASGFGRGNTTPPHPNYMGPPSLIWGDAVIECSVDTATQRVLSARLLSSEGGRGLDAGRDYQITIFVRNPSFPVEAGPTNKWVLETYNGPEDSGALPLFRDMSEIPGYEVLDQPRVFMYKNGLAGAAPARLGMRPVPGLYFEMMFPIKLEIGDVVQLTAPAGFTFTEVEGLPGVCQGFRWEPVADAQLYLPESSRVCSGSTMTFTVEERRFFPEMRIIKFRTDSMNPARTPHVMLNMWKVTHYKGQMDAGEVISTRAALSWMIVPQLAELRIMLVGSKRSASSEGARLAISFIPVSDADIFELQANQPVGFDFTGCLTTSVGHEMISTDVEKVRIRASMYSGVQTDIVIDDFRLGNIGGQTEFHIRTVLNNGEQMDEALYFRGGFRLPGSVTVNTPRLTSMYQLAPEQYPVTSLWDTRIGEGATADFPFTITVMASIGDMIRVRAPPYIIKAENFRIMRVPGNKIVSSEVVSAAYGELVARLSEELFVTNTYEIRVSVDTPMNANSAAAWTLELLDGQSLPLDTNDGKAETFKLVEQIDLKMLIGRSPPLAEVPAEIRIDPKGATPTEFIVVAPVGFNFTEDCLVSPGDNNEIESCEVMFPNVAGYAAARIKTRPGGLSRPTEYVVIRIITPATTPAENSWYVSAMGPTGEQLGWGHDPLGIEVRQMVGAGVVYPGIPHISGQLAIQFVTNEKIDQNGIIRVGYPKSIVIDCNGGFFYPIALEGQVECRNMPQLGYFELEMARPLPPGQQAFAVTSMCPDQVREQNSFYIVVRNPLGQVVDAAMEVPGYKIIHGLKVSALDIIWGYANPGQQSVISMGFELLEELPDQSPPIISEIVVTIPRDFEHRVVRASNIESLASPIPLRKDISPFDVTNLRKVVMFLDEEKTSKLEVGRYSFSFPLLLPSRMPKYNVYTITLCGPNPAGVNASCTGQDDQRALVSFPLSGFAMRTASPQANQFMAIAGARRSVDGRVPALTGALLVLQLLVSAALRPAR